MAGIAAATLTGAGFSAGTAGAGLSGGTAYTKAVNAMSVVVTLYTEVEGSGFAGVVQVFSNGDVAAADYATVAALLTTIGFKNFATWPNNTNVQFNLGVAGVNGTQVVYSQSF
jgi:hypothetical protein